MIDELKEAQENGDHKAVEEIIDDILENEDKIMHHGKRAEAHCEKYASAFPYQYW